MSKALRLIIRGEHVNQSHVFRTFPVRIGREPDYECRLGFSFVSRRHARIELNGSRLVLHDEGSKFGTFVRGMSRRVMEPISLDEVGGEFQIGTLAFHTELFDEASAVDVGDWDAPNEKPTIPNPTRTYAQAEVDPANVDAEAVLDQTRAFLLHRRDTARDLVVDALAAVGEQHRTAALRELVRGFPELLQVPALAELVSTCGVDVTHPDVALAAHGALEGLLSKYAPKRGPLDEAERIEAFARQLDEALECLIEGVSGLLFAHGCESGLEDAGPTTAEIAALLLEDQGGDEGVALLSQAFVNLVTHHARITRGALEAFQTLLHELSPDGFEKAHSGLFATGARWRAYRKRHRELASLDVATFARLFGVTFARTCAALSGVSAAPAAAEENVTEPESAPPPALPVATPSAC